MIAVPIGIDIGVCVDIDIGVSVDIDIGVGMHIDVCVRVHIDIGVCVDVYFDIGIAMISCIMTFGEASPEEIEYYEKATAEEKNQVTLSECMKT